MYTKIKTKVYNLIRDDDENDLWSNIFDGVIITLILLNILFVVLDTFTMPEWYTPLADVVETVSVVIFTVEYILRLWTADLHFGRGRFLSRLKHAFSFMAIIDLLAILPFYIPMLIAVDLRVLRAFRVLRLFRIFKFSRYAGAMRIIADVLKRKHHQLISSVAVILVLMIISSVLIYTAEHEAQPDVFDNAFSGLWWAVATFTTVGYGDIFPITVLGKLFAALIAMLGIGLVAVPTGIISAGFIEVSDEADTKSASAADAHTDEKRFCPYCGHEYEK